MLVIPTSIPADDGRPAADHRRQRNATTRSVVGTLRRTPTPSHHRGESGPVPLEALSDVNESSMPRVKKKIKHKRTWDEPEAQGSEVRNTTSKRPDRIKTRRRLLVPSSTTARALRTAVVSSPQEESYYDFGKKIRQPVQSPSPHTTVEGLNAPPDSETRTSVRLPVVVQQVMQDATPRVRVPGPPPHNRTHSAVAPTRRPTENSAPVECLYPRFSRRNNKSRTRRDVRCLPESDGRTTRILSTVVTSVSVRGSPQKRNDSTADLGRHSIDNHRTADANDGDDATGVYNPVSPTSTVSPDFAVSAYPKYLRNRYRNISLPEYLEITKVNQRRLNGTTVVGTTSTIAYTTITTTSTTTASTTATPVFALASSSNHPVDGTTETLDASTTGDRSSTDTSQPPPTDLQDFIYLNNGTSEAPVDDIATDAAGTVASTIHTTTTVDAAVEARQRRPLLQRGNVTRPSAEHDVGVVYPDGLATSVYFLTFLAIVPLVLVIVFAFKLAMRRKKKKVFDSSEYSSEYNRSPLDFNTITSSPITTKLPRVPQHIVWDAEKTPAVPVPMNNGRWEFPREKLRLQTILGQGNFGQVWKAEADDISGHEGLTRLVAVKMVKEDAASREREDLIRELSIMQHLGSHPNVVTLLGCCTEKGIIHRI